MEPAILADDRPERTFRAEKQAATGLQLTQFHVVAPLPDVARLE
jgi:hypothetical protein